MVVSWQISNANSLFEENSQFNEILASSNFSAEESKYLFFMQKSNRKITIYMNIWQINVSSLFESG